jgi:hypothetical protein
MKKYRKNNKEKRNKYCREFRQKNLKKSREKAREGYYKKKNRLNKLSNIESIPYWVTRIRSRLKERQNLTKEHLVDLSKKGLNLYPYIVFNSKGKRAYFASLDRIDSNKGYIKKNVQVIPLWLNSAKLDLSEIELKKLMKGYLDNETI